MILNLCKFCHGNFDLNQFNNFNLCAVKWIELKQFFVAVTGLISYSIYSTGKKS